MTLEAQVDAVLMKLSEAKLGDVLVIRADYMRDAYALQEALSNVRLPPGVLPKGGVPVVCARTGVEWGLEQFHAPRPEDYGASPETCTVETCK